MLRHAAFTALVVLSCAYVLASPPGEGIGIGSIFTGPFGRMFVLPVMVVGGLIHLWRMLALALSTENALVFTDEGMRVATAGGVKLLPWSDFREAQVQKIWVGWRARFRYLVLKRVHGRAIRLRLDLTTAHGANNELIYELIRLSQAAAFARGKPVGPAFHQWLGEDAPAAPTPTAARGAFDPDAALARYLERKKAGMLEAPPSPIAKPPARAGFGRKGL